MKHFVLTLFYGMKSSENNYKILISCVRNFKYNRSIKEYYIIEFYVCKIICKVMVILCCGVLENICFFAKQLKLSIFLELPEYYVLYV